MTTYQILRKEVSKDKNGNNEVFAHVEIYDDELGIIHYPKWYRGKLADDIITNGDTLDQLISSIITPILTQKRIELNRVVVPSDLPVPNLPEKPS